MAVRVFAVQNVPDNADLARQAISSLVPNGGGIIQSGDFAVTQTSTPSMVVQAAPGRAWIDGTSVAHISGEGYGNQGQYFLINDSVENITLDTSSATNPRIDVIYAAVADAFYTGSSNTPVVTVATGAPTAGASYPTNAPALPANALAIAWIYVAANASSVSNGNITSLSPTVVGPPHPVTVPLVGSISGYSVVGNLTAVGFGSRTLITISGYINKTSFNASIPGGSVSYTSITSIIPSQYLGSYSLPFSWVGACHGSGADATFECYLNPANGLFELRGNGSTQTWVNGSQIDITASYYI